MPPFNEAAAVKALNLDDPRLPVNHRDSFRFLAQEFKRQVPSVEFLRAARKLQPSQYSDAVSATDGKPLQVDRPRWGVGCAAVRERSRRMRPPKNVPIG